MLVNSKKVIIIIKIIERDSSTAKILGKAAKFNRSGLTFSCLQMGHDLNHLRKFREILPPGGEGDSPPGRPGSHLCNHQDL